jgi:hypothetical protein
MYWIEQVFLVLEALGGRLQIFFKLQKQRNNVQGFNLLCVHKCLFISLSIQNLLKTKTKNFI